MSAPSSSSESDDESGIVLSESFRARTRAAAKDVPAEHRERLTRSKMRNLLYGNIVAHTAALSTLYDPDWFDPNAKVRCRVKVDGKTHSVLAPFFSLLMLHKRSYFIKRDISEDRKERGQILAALAQYAPSLEDPNGLETPLIISPFHACLASGHHDLATKMLQNPGIDPNLPINVDRSSRPVLESSGVIISHKHSGESDAYMNPAERAAKKYLKARFEGGQIKTKRQALQNLLMLLHAGALLPVQTNIGLRDALANTVETSKGAAFFFREEHEMFAYLQAQDRLCHELLSQGFQPSELKIEHLHALLVNGQASELLKLTAESAPLRKAALALESEMRPALRRAFLPALHLQQHAAEARPGGWAARADASRGLGHAR